MGNPASLEGCPSATDVVAAKGKIVNPTRRLCNRLVADDTTAGIKFPTPFPKRRLGAGGAKTGSNIPAKVNLPKELSKSAML
jgi:hypothetical protein